MKALILVCLVSVYAGSLMQGQAVGESCLKTPNFLIRSFTVDPWPLFLHQGYTISMFGTFTKTELLDQIAVGFKKDFSWNYTFFNINQNFLVNTNNTFTYQLAGPPSKGTFTEQVTLHRPDYSTFACWEFNYQIS